MIIGSDVIGGFQRQLYRRTPCFRNCNSEADEEYKMDPWVILPQERGRHMEQFSSVGPADGFITGGQARGFFMQSGLPPPVLAQIW